MNLGLSLYLDMVRIIAALAVFLDHLGFPALTGGILPKRISQYGGIAVVVFFVLSGYIIAHVIQRNENTARTYSIMRFSRLMSVIPLALLLTYGADTLGSLADPALYENNRVLDRPPSILYYLSSLFFINEFQAFPFRGGVPGTNAPLWSLSFEATYYVLAGLMVFAPRRIAIVSVLGIALLAGQTIVALFPLWGLGYALQRYSTRLSMKPTIAWLVFLTSLALLIAWPDIIPHLNRDNWGFNFPWGRNQVNRTLSRDYLGAFLFALNLISAHTVCRNLNPRPAITGIIRRAGAMTFPLYCMHFPLLCVLVALNGSPVDSVENLLFIAFGTLLIVICLTPLTSWLRELMRRGLAAIFPDKERKIPQLGTRA